MYSTLEGLTDKELFLYEHLLNNNFPNIRDEDVKSVKQVGPRHILVTYKNGKRFIWYPSNNTFINVEDSDVKSKNQEFYEFKHLMQYWMISKNKNTTTLAEDTNVNQSTISRYINCKRLPDIFTIKRIADALDISINDLFFDY